MKLTLTLEEVPTSATELQLPKYCNRACITLPDGTKIYIEGSEYIEIYVEEPKNETNT